MYLKFEIFEYRNFGKKEAFAVYFVLIGLVLLAVYFDYKSFKIPNRLCFLGMIFGTIWNGISLGNAGLKKSILGILAPIFILFILFLLGVLGAGDIKLFAAIGAFIGIKVFKIVVISFVVASLYGIVLIAGKIKKNIKRNLTRMHIGQKELSLTKIHMSFPIAISTFVFVVEAML